jgi:hypothetical protein
MTATYGPRPALPKLAVGEAMTLVVVDDTGTAGPGIDPSVLHRQCQRLERLGWTPDTLTAAARAHTWTGAGPGAVIAWLRGRTAPPVPRPRAPACDGCAGTGWRGEDTLGRPIRCGCRLAA